VVLSSYRKRPWLGQEGALCEASSWGSDKCGMVRMAFPVSLMSMCRYRYAECTCGVGKAVCGGNWPGHAFIAPVSGDVVLGVQSGVATDYSDAARGVSRGGLACARVAW